jgi:hypothetical protein
MVYGSGAVPVDAETMKIVDDDMQVHTVCLSFSGPIDR